MNEIGYFMDAAGCITVFSHLSPYSENLIIDNGDFVVEMIGGTWQEAIAKLLEAGWEQLE